MSKRKTKKVELPKVEYINFSQFFQRCVAQGVLKPFQEKELYAFFRDKGLRDKEDLDKFQKALKEY